MSARSSKRKGPALITGGAGFIGTNLARRLLSGGEPVRILDDLSRPGVERNLDWLTHAFGAMVEFRAGDVRDSRAVAEAVSDASSVFHFAAQVAVTTSLADPVSDFDVNVRGTLNVLEALRQRVDRVPLVFTSTNKVYGALPHLELSEVNGRYQPSASAPWLRGVPESCPLDFHSPYGCSKGAADQYVLDYARSFGLPNVVFRMSCIYGPHQFGTEDQGWVAHFLIRALAGEPITIYGDGMQVRDLLFVGDLVEAFVLARKQSRALGGRAFNIGGGAGNAVSLLDVIDLLNQLNQLNEPGQPGQLHKLGDEPPRVTFDSWRIGDQRYYVSDFSSFQRATGWTPKVGVSEGLRKLADWLVDQRRPAESFPVSSKVA